MGGHATLALLASVVGAAGALLSGVASVGVEQTGEGGQGQVTSQGLVLLFCAGLVLQYVVTGFATGVAAPAISALGDTSIQGRLMSLHSGLEVGGRMGGQVLVAALYEISPLAACALPVVANAIAAAAMGVALGLERREARVVGSPLM